MMAFAIFNLRFAIYDCAQSQIGNRKSKILFLLAALILGTPCYLLAAENDPARELDAPRALSNAQRREINTLFERVGAENFDERQTAKNALIKMGPGILDAAKQFESSADPEVRHFAAGLRDDILLDYHGYLPTAPELLDLLGENQRVFIGKLESFADAFRRFTRACGLRVLFKGAPPPAELLLGRDETVELQMSVDKALQLLLMPAGLAAIPRGDAVIVTTRERAAALVEQEYVFKLTPLALSPEATAHFAATLSAWLPHGAAVESGNTLRVAGTEADLRMAARALSLLRRDAPAAQYPRAQDAAAVARLFEALARPVSALKVNGNEPLRAITRLKALGQPVQIDPQAAALTAVQPAVSLDVAKMPLGFCLKWLAKRSAPATLLAAGAARLDYVVDVGASKIVAELLPMDAVGLLPTEALRPLPESVGGADVEFLYPAGGDPVGQAGQQAERALREALGNELSLYPDIDASWALAVCNKRLVVRGPESLVARALMMVEEWRKSGKAPACAWRAEMERQLNAEIEWNGAALSPDNLIPFLRERSGLNVLLAHNDENGKVQELDVTPEFRVLQPAGKIVVRELLARLCKAADAKWIIQWGAVLLSKADAEPPGK